MTRTYNFKFYDGHTIFVTVPIMNHCVRTNDLMPDFLKQFPFGFSISLQDMNEFHEDCQSIINEINNNRWQYNSDTSYYFALKSVVKKHINSYGRLFFSDLTSYVDDCCYLMRGFGFDSERLKSEVYLQLICLIIREFSDYIKDGNPMIGIVPFTTTPKYGILLQQMNL